MLDRLVRAGGGRGGGRGEGRGEEQGAQNMDFPKPLTHASSKQLFTTMHEMVQQL